MIVEQVEPRSVAETAGLIVGDRVVAVDDCPIVACTRDECLSLFKFAELTTRLLVQP